MRGYRLSREADDNGSYLITCPALPEVTTFGETSEDSLRNARHAIEEALAARIAAGAEVPAGEEPTKGMGWARLAALPALKVDLYEALREAGITRAELARRLDWNRNSVDRLFQLDHESRLEQIEAAAAALGMVVRAELTQPEYVRAPA
jgi:antitoxin HicB